MDGETFVFTRDLSLRIMGGGRTELVPSRRHLLHELGMGRRLPHDHLAPNYPGNQTPAFVVVFVRRSTTFIRGALQSGSRSRRRGRNGKALQSGSRSSSRGRESRCRRRSRFGIPGRIREGRSAWRLAVIICPSATADPTSNASPRRHPKACGSAREKVLQNEADLLPNLPSLIRRVCSSFAPDWGVLRTRLV